MQGRPYFINAFLRQRLNATRRSRGLLAAYEATGDPAFIEQLRTFMVAQGLPLEA